MKKLSILFLSVLGLGITVTSCSKDEAPASIVGKWEFNTMDGTSGGTTIAAGTPEQIYADPNCTANKSYWQFDNGTPLHWGLYQSSQNCELQTLEATYSVDSKNTTLTTVTPGGTYTYTITKLTSTELWLRQQGTGTGTDADGNPTTVTYDITHHMVRK